MRTLSLTLLALAFAAGAVSSANACTWMKTAQTQTTVAEAEQPATPSTKIKVPGAGS